MSWLALLPVPHRIALIALVVVGIFGFGWVKGAGSVQARWDKARAGQLQAVIAAEQAARHKEQSMQQKLNEAQNAATEREKALRADYAAAHVAARGLRDTVAALRGQLATAPAEACRATADAALAVFGECSDRYRAVAEAADGHASDVETLTEAWPE